MKQTLKLALLCTVAVLSMHAKKDKDSVLDSINQKVSHINSLIGASACTPITQNMVNNGGGTFTITGSGSYCLASDINGVIVINSDAVNLSLGSHILNAQGAANAIVINGHHSIVIYDQGIITNASSAGIAITNSTSVVVSDLDMTNMPLNSIQAAGSTDVFVKGVNFFNSNSGETALNFASCNNVGVADCGMSGFLTTIGAIVQFQSCKTVVMSNVNIFNNTKSIAASNTKEAVNASFVHADNSSNIIFEGVRVNNNTIANGVAVVTKYTNMIGFTTCTNGSFDGCEANGNININGLGSNTLTNLAIDAGILIRQSNNFLLKTCQVNNNTFPVAMGTFLGYFTPDTTGLEFIECQFNNNFIASAPLNTATPIFSGFAGFVMQVENVLPQGDHILRSCQANRNVITDGGVRTQPGKTCRIFGYQVQGPAIVDGCQANHNSIGTTGANQKIVGINCSTVGLIDTNIVISNCTANDNTGGLWASGIRGATQPTAGGRAVNFLIIGCSANGNNGYGLFFGDDDTPATPVIRNIEIIDCVFQKNSNATRDAAGIVLTTEPLTTAINNVLIKNCQIYDTSSTATAVSQYGVLGAFGIRAQNINNLVIENTNIYDTVATSTGFGGLADGVHLTNVTDSKIINSQFHGNSNNGVYLGGVVTDVAILNSIAMDNDNGFNIISTSTATQGLMQDNRALSNRINGFWHQPGTLNTVFIGNEAQFNAANNYLINGGTINLQTLSVSTGALVVISGGAAPGARFTNISQIS